MEDDLDELLDEVEEKFCRDDPALCQTQGDSSHAPKHPSDDHGKHRCRPVFLGGSSVKYGVGTLVSQRSCDQLRCTSCDFRVLTFEDQEWDGSCDYLFLRNNMPDGERLQARLRRSRGRRAYACQCSWFSAGDLADLSQQPQLRWVCGKHPA
ncbi:hypothetical protein CRUP_012018 [Coryphaenoides rupestris]|nr:hypothetical protein CRUP_012018 [Coryphaenoides rupestris]